MKKKLALLLAAVMTISSVPMSLSASNRLTNTTITPGANAILFEQGMVGTGNTGARVRPTAAVAANADFRTHVERWTNGTNLEIVLEGRVRQGDQFTLQLQNGVWFFRDATPPSAVNVPILGPEVSGSVGYQREGFVTATFVPATPHTENLDRPVNFSTLLSSMNALPGSLVVDVSFELGDLNSFSDDWLAMADLIFDVSFADWNDAPFTESAFVAAFMSAVGSVIPLSTIAVNGIVGNNDDHRLAAVNRNQAARLASQNLSNAITQADINAGWNSWSLPGDAANGNIRTSFPSDHRSGTAGDANDNPQMFGGTSGVTGANALVAPHLADSDRDDIALNYVNGLNLTSLFMDSIGGVGPAIDWDLGTDVEFDYDDGELVVTGLSIDVPVVVTQRFDLYVLRAGRAQVVRDWAFVNDRNAGNNSVARPTLPFPMDIRNRTNVGLSDVNAGRSAGADTWSVQGNWSVNGVVGWTEDDSTAFPSTLSTFVRVTDFESSSPGGFLLSHGGQTHYYRIPGRTMNGGNWENITPNPAPSQLGYVMTFGANETAVVTILEDGGRGDIITIPIVARTTNNNGLRVNIQADHNTSGALSGTPRTFTLGERATGNTTTVISDTGQSAQGVWLNINFDELSSGVISSSDWWSIDLVAPAGYTWARRSGSGTGNTSNADHQIHAATQNGLFFNRDRVLPDRFAPTNNLRGDVVWNSALTTEQVVTNNGANNATSIDVRYHVSGNRVDERRLTVSFPANAFVNTANQVRGRLSINNLVLVPDVDLPIEQGRTLAIDTVNRRGNVITNQRNVTVLSLNDFGINLVPQNDIPTLISGRLELDTNSIRSFSNVAPGWLTTNPWNDEEHKAAVIRVSENLRDSWWAERQTEFRLPEDVRFGAVEFHEITNDRVGESSTATQVDWSTLWRGSSDNQLATRWNPSPFFNTGTRINGLYLNDNRIMLPRLHSHDTGLTRYDMHIWVNIQVDFEGEIIMGWSNTGFRNVEDNYDASVVIANAVRPIEVVTQVRDARVGFQFVSTADFAIVENVAGALLHGEQVNVTITDLISTDMAFAPGLVGAVTDGDIRVSNVRHLGNLGTLGAGGWLNNAQGSQLSFTVESASRIPSTIEFTNVQVKIDRTVPFSNISNIETTGYDLHVWGPAVARNFLGVWGQNTIAQRMTTGSGINERDLFIVGSISAPYVQIATPGELNHTPFSNHVELPIPSSIVRINGVETDLGVETWICPVTSSTMVPIRFIAYALGLEPTAVSWDPVNSTVTIDAISSGGRIVQFQTGNSAYIVNGVAVRMMNPEGLPVEMQIRNERSFVPFRALGEAFGIPVSWNAETSTAIYNAPFHFGQEQ